MTQPLKQTFDLNETLVIKDLQFTIVHFTRRGLVLRKAKSSADVRKLKKVVD